MLDIKVIRENLDWAKDKLATRGIKPEELDELIQIDARRREALNESEQLKADVTMFQRRLVKQSVIKRTLAMPLNQ